MIVGVPKEPISGENRVAATPESVKQLVKARKVLALPPDMPMTHTKSRVQL
jgi:alanine dehydrogenase